MITDTAWSHNSIYNFKDITDMYDSGEFSKNVSDGSFKGIYPGCYIKKTKVIDSETYIDHIDIIMSLDPYYGKNNGSGEFITTHHVALIPYNRIGISKMNSTNIVTGGYYSSYMRNTTLPKYLTGYKNAYGSSHFLTFGELISNRVGTSGTLDGRSTGWTWCVTQITLMGEIQVYGSTIFSSEYDIGEACTQLEAFRLNPILQQFDHGGFWLRGVANTVSFSEASGNGNSDASGATNTYRVRPLFLLY